MPINVARPDDNVHTFFGQCSTEVLNRLMTPELIDSLQQTLAPWHRQRRFTLRTMLWLGLFAAGHAALGSMEMILQAAIAAFEGQPCMPLRPHTLTQSGWSRARAGLSLGLLKTLWHHWLEMARVQAGDSAYFAGMRLVALDKKTLTVPQARHREFGSHDTRGVLGPTQAALLVAYDVCLRAPIEFTLGRCDRDESPLARRILRRLDERCLLLIDSGFYGIGLFAEILDANHHFLTVMRSNGRPKLIKCLSRGDGLYVIRPGRSYTHARYPDLPRSMLVRIVEVHRRGYPTRRLVTSLLDEQAVTREMLIDLYHRRWHIETFFRELSSDVQFEHWHTRTVKGLYVELLFTMAYVTAVRLEMARAATQTGVPPGMLSFSRSAPVCMRVWSSWGKSGPERHGELHRQLIDHLGTLRIDIRPNRWFERDTQKRRAASRAKHAEVLRSKRNAA